MEKVPKWFVVLGEHTSADQTVHITVEVARTRYHIRLTAAGIVFHITFKDKNGLVRTPSGRTPWVAPGSEPPNLKDS
jgi:hypothetical protein